MKIWTEVSSQELDRIGKTGWVYIPSGYPGPIAVDAKMAKNPTITDAKE
jgi:hypothetical protein